MEDMILVLGLGNPLRGDDGVGLVVLEQLKSCELPAGTTLVDGGTRGLDLTLEFEGKARAILIDAAHFRGTGGEFRRFDLLSAKSLPINWAALHAQGIGAAIELAGALGTLPKQLILFAIEPQSIVESQRLSAAVEQAVPKVVRAVCDELTCMAYGKAQDSRRFAPMT